MLDDQAKATFIGRVDILQSFEANFYSDEPPRMLFAISGDGGVGKTMLLDQLRLIAEEATVDSLVISCDDRQSWPVDVIDMAAQRLTGHSPKSRSLRELRDRLRKYRKLRTDIDADEDAPPLAKKLVRPAVSKGVRVAGHLPALGALTELVDSEVAGEAAEELTSYLWRRVRSEDNIRLVRHPEQVLTSLLVEGINEMAATGCRVVLFFDVLERTSPRLEDWLFDLLRSHYGDLDPLLVTVVAGRDELGQRFAQFGPAAARVRLEPFTHGETALYLTQRSITDAGLIDAINRETAGLPVLVELLASRDPAPGEPLPDVSGDTVERFLQWIDDPDRRRACLYAAIPRWVNTETLSLALGATDATDLFEWLSEEPFMRRPTDTVPGFHYHEKVRELMLRHLRSRSPGRVAAIHQRLAGHAQQKLRNLGTDPSNQDVDKSSRLIDLERVYHVVSSTPDKAIQTAAEEVLLAHRWNDEHYYDVAVSVERALAEHAHSVESSPVLALAEAVRSRNGAKVADLFDELRGMALSARALSEMYYLAYRASGDRDDSLIEEAIRLDPTNFRAFIQKGLRSTHEHQHDAAIAAFTTALEINPHDSWAYTIRSNAFVSAGRYNDALADQTHAIALDASASNYHLRAIIYDLVGRFGEALTDQNQAIELNRGNAHNYAHRGSIYRKLGQYNEAIDDLTHAILLDPNDGWSHAERGSTYQDLGRRDDAIADLTRAIELNPNTHWPYMQRGLVFGAIGNNDHAISDLTRAIELKRDDVSIHIARAAVRHNRGRYDAAIIDATHAIELDPLNDWNYHMRAGIYRALRQYDKAIADFRQAIKLKPDNACNYLCLGLTYDEMYRPIRATTCLTRAVELDPNHKRAYAARGGVYLMAGNHQAAIPDLTRAIELDPDDRRAKLRLGLAHRVQGDIAACDRILQMLAALSFETPDHAGLVATWHQSEGRSDVATAAAHQAQDLPATDGWDDLGQCLAHIVLGDEATATALAIGAVAKDRSLQDLISKVDLLADVRRLLSARA